MGDLSFDYDAYNKDNFNDYNTFNSTEYDHILSEYKNSFIMDDKIITLSSEQNDIIDAVEQGKNVIVDAVPGSGKTTLVLGLAKKINTKQILQITYNANLKHEVRDKVKQLQLNNLTVHSFHSVATNYYDENAYIDDIIQNNIINNNVQIKNKNVHFDIIVIDEAQDMILLYFILVKKFIKDCAIDPILLILGDKDQDINAWKGADRRFLTLADKIWERGFSRLNLNTSYRLTNEIADFINKLSGKNIHTIKAGPKVKYVHGFINTKNDTENNSTIYTAITNNFKDNSIFKNCGYIVGIIIKIILQLINSKKFKPEDIFILTPSVSKDSHFTKKIGNYLSEKHGIKIYIPNSDEEKIDKKIINNKLVIGTLASSKGLERKIVFVCHFDDTYYKQYAKNKPLDERDKLENIHYVALSRASHCLYVVHIEKYHNCIEKFSALTCVKKIFNNLKGCIDIPYKNPNIFYNGEINKSDIWSSGVKRFVSHIPSQDSNYINTYLLKYKKIDKTYDIKLQGIHEFSYGNYENISTLFGTSIPMIWEHKKYGKCSILEELNANLYLFENNNKKIIIKNNIDYVLAANMYESMLAGTRHKLIQVDNYDWFNQSNISGCLSVFDDIVEHIDIFEKNIYINMLYKTPNNKYMNIKLGGIIDGIIDGINTSTIWEFKCVSELDTNHMLQLLVYAFMWENLHYKDNNGNLKRCIIDNKKGYVKYENGDEKIIDLESKDCCHKYTNREYKLFNCRTGEVWILKYENILEIILKICEIKYKTYIKQSDDKFTDECLKSLEILNTDKIMNTV